VSRRDVLEHNAPGSATIQAELKRRYGKSPTRATICTYLRDLFGSPTGRLKESWSFQADRYVQADTYDVQNIATTLGTYGLKLLNRLKHHQPPTALHRRHRDSPLVQNYARRALEIALTTTAEGFRHRDGARLVWHLAGLGFRLEVLSATIFEYAERVGIHDARWAQRAAESASRKQQARLPLRAAEAA
jgi:hypothetical protein